ncbi:MAG: low-specificity L-threonine aldolase [Desulfobacteraceae bacterium]
MIDLRSDTITKPTPAMRNIMAEAEVGDDVYGEDPCVNRLETLAAEMTGMEAALFAPSGTQSNLLALLSHCERGDEYIVGQQAHTYKYEGGGAAVLGSIQPQPLEFEQDGTLDLARVAGAIKEDDFHFAKTRLLCLENTQAGKVLPMAYLEEAGRFARDKGLALHLDGARLFNAAVNLNRPARKITQPFDSVSICLSKGLGAPVGSLVCGSQTLIARARKWRKMLGGGMRQAGVLAAAGQFALENNIDRLETDHENARLLAKNLSRIKGVTVHPDSGITNMVFITLAKKNGSFSNFMESREILVPRGEALRLVTHLDVTGQDMALVTEAFGEYCSS